MGDAVAVPQDLRTRGAQGARGAGAQSAHGAETQSDGGDRAVHVWHSMLTMRRPIAIAFLIGALTTLSAQNPPFELLVRGGRIIDGTGAAARRGDIGIRDGQVAGIGDLSGAPAKDTIDATGLVVAPGFIDVHTHADDLDEHPLAENFVRMGVTTIVAGNCGSSALDIGGGVRANSRRRRFRQLRHAHRAQHRPQRRDGNRAQAADPGRARQDEVARLEGDGGRRRGFLDRPAVRPGHVRRDARDHRARAGGRLTPAASTPRTCGTKGRRSRRRSGRRSRVGETATCRVQVSHLKVDSPSRWGASATRPGSDRCGAHARRRRARRSVRVHRGELQPGDPFSVLGARRRTGEDPRAAEGCRDVGASGARCSGLLADRGLSDLSFATIASHAADPSLNGLTIKEAAAKRKGSDSADAQFEQARDMLLAGGATMVYHFMSDEDVDRIMRHPQVGVASDASVLDAGRRRAASARVRQQRARARPIRPRAPRGDRSRRRFGR